MSSQFAWKMSNFRASKSSGFVFSIRKSHVAVINNNLKLCHQLDGEIVIKPLAKECYAGDDPSME